MGDLGPFFGKLEVSLYKGEWFSLGKLGISPYRCTGLKKLDWERIIL